MTDGEGERGPDRETILAALCNAIMASAAAVPEGEATFSLEAEAVPGGAPEIPLMTASGGAGLTIERLDGRDLTTGIDGLTLVERLKRAEPLVSALETLLGLEFSPGGDAGAKMAATLRITVRDKAGEVLHILALGLTAKLIDALPMRENLPPALRHTLPVLVDLIIMVGGKDDAVAEGDILLLGSAGRAEAILHVPDPVGAFGVDVDMNGARVAGAAQAPGDGIAFRIAALRLSVQSVVAAKRGDALSLPADLSGHVHLPGGEEHPAQFISIGDAVGIRIGTDTEPTDRKVA